MYKYLILMSMVSALFADKVFSSEDSKSGCVELNSANAIIECIQNIHPDVLLSNMQVQSDAFGIDKAGQLLNPELEIEVFDKKGEGISGEIGLIQKFQLGGKISAKEGLAIAQKEKSELELTKLKEQVTLQTVIDLYRIRQIKKELEIVDENITTFSKLLRKYPNPSRLGPEQRVSVSVFELSQRENSLKENQLKNELDRIYGKLEWIFGKKVDLNEKMLPAQKTIWPTLEPKETQSTDLKLAKNDLSIRENELNIEKSNSWPDLSFGPKFGVESAVQGKTEYTVGVQLSLPLPLFSANGGGRDQARSMVTREVAHLKNKEKKLSILKEKLILGYQRIVNSLNKINQSRDVEKQHIQLHRLLNRGVVSAPLVIESHRQLLEYFESFHQQELEGVEILWTIYALEGRILNEKINP